MKKIELLKKRVLKIENELLSCRTSVLQDGWQTQRFARKSRKWDMLAQEKMNLLSKIEDLEMGYDNSGGYIGEALNSKN